MPDADLPSDAGAETAACTSSHLRVLRPHAEGGLGQVSVALDEEFNREVAFKEIQPRHANHPPNRDRFVREAEITGGLEHPGVVPVYGVGRHADGRPFYAMRFIKGRSLEAEIAAFHEVDARVCASGERALALRKLVGHFVDVCHTMSYAHSRGVLHRDLKPANIMLGEYGETLVVDWGLAKTVDREDALPGDEADVLQTRSGGGEFGTLHGSALGTPEFMSPEQATGQIDQLGPATDIYALGATFYAVLTGQPAIRGDDLDEMLATVTAGTWSRPREVNSSVPKPLDAICAKAMALKPEDRYASATSMADDVERWLGDEPVVAYSESLPERLSRWGRRYRTFVRAGAVALMVITAVAVVAAFLIDDARRNEAQQRELADDALLKETEARQTAERVVDLMVEGYESPDPDRDGRKVTVVEVLDRQVTRLRDDLGDQPVLKAKLLDAIGRSYRSLGLHREAVPILEETRDLRETYLGGDHDDTLVSTNMLAFTYMNAGRLDDAVPLLEGVLQLRRSKFGEEHDETIGAMNNAATAYEFVGRSADAIALFEKAYDLRREKLGKHHKDTLSVLNNLAGAYQQAGRVDEAIALHEEILKVRKQTLGLDDDDTVRTMANLAEAFMLQERPAQAVPLYEHALADDRKRYGDDHPSTLDSVGDLAWAYNGAGRTEEALALFREVANELKTKRGENHPLTLTFMSKLASAYGDAGQRKKAIALFEDTIARLRETRGEKHGNTIATICNLALMYSESGDFERALPHAEAALQSMPDEMSRNRLVMMGNLAHIYSGLGRYEQALPLRKSILEGTTAIYDADHRDTLRALDDLAQEHYDAGKLQDAIPLYEESLRRHRAVLGENEFDTIASMNNMALLYRTVGQSDQAIPLYLAALEWMQENLGHEHANTLTVMDGAALSYYNASQFAEAIRLGKKALAGARETLGGNHTSTVKYANNLAIYYAALGELEKAIALGEEFGLAKEVAEWRTQLEVP